MDAQVLKIWLKLLRPHQYIKNTFVLIGILFSHHWDMLSIVQAAWVFCAFSATASAVYVLNDIVDRNADRAHPTKCTRPLASGAVSVQAAFKWPQKAAPQARTSVGRIKNSDRWQPAHCPFTVSPARCGGIFGTRRQTPARQTPPVPRPPSRCAPARFRCAASPSRPKACRLRCRC